MRNHEDLKIIQVMPGKGLKRRNDGRVYKKYGIAEA
jgi:hypothetical protein